MAGGRGLCGVCGAEYLSRELGATRVQIIGDLAHFQWFIHQCLFFLNPFLSVFFLISF